MEQIIFDTNTKIYKTKLNLVHIKNELLNECDEVIKSKPTAPADNFGYGEITWGNNLDFNGEITIKQKLDVVVNLSIQKCKELYSIEYNKINTDAWINRVRAKNPVQPNFKEKNEIIFHNHVELAQSVKSFIPTYTYVYYIQMPDNLNNKDGVLYIGGDNGIIYDILPEEDDLIIMDGTLPHVPASAYNSTKDRIVLAGNVGFEYIKKEKSLI